MWKSNKKAIKLNAQNLLSNTFGYPVLLSTGRTIPSRSHIYRFNVINSSQNLTQNLLVKQTRDIQNHILTASGYPAQSWLLFNDWAGLQFMQQTFPDNSLSPRFYTGSREHGMIISEDIGPNKSLAPYLQGRNPLAAERALLQFAMSLGKMHAGTIGKQQEFDIIRDALAPRVETWGWVPPWLRREAEFSNFLNTMDQHTRKSGFGSYLWMKRVFQQVTAALNIIPVSGIEKEVELLISAMRNPGPFLALTHDDLCFDNFLLSGSTVKFVDFENVAYRHALIDGVYPRMNFPTCAAVQHSVPEQIVQRMETVYRTELIKGCPEAADNTLFYHAVVEACAYWVLLLYQFDAIPHFSRQDAKTVIMPQRILHRFECFAQTTQEFGHLEALGATFQAVAVKLRTLWPLKEDTIDVYPVFKRKGITH